MAEMEHGSSNEDERIRRLMDELKSQESLEELELWAKETLEQWEKGERKWYTFEEIMEELEHL